MWRAVRHGIAVLAVAAAVPAPAVTILVDTLVDSADPPFDAPGPCGSGSVDDLPGADSRVSLREALIAANNSPGPHVITFLNPPAGGLLELSFDGPDPGAEADPLPWLCGGNITVDGDVDDDGEPDIILSAARLAADATGLRLASGGNDLRGLAFEQFGTAVLVQAPPGAATVMSGTRFVGNRVNGRDGIVVRAGSADPPEAGQVTNTTIARNVFTVTGSAIAMISGPIRGSSIAGASISENSTQLGGEYGVALIAGGSAESVEASIADVIVRRNEVFDTTRAAIAVLNDGGRSHGIRGIQVRENSILSNLSAGVVIANVCGVVDSVIEAEVLDNLVFSNGGPGRRPGMALLGGSNLDCPPATSRTESNRLAATVSRNRLGSNSGGDIVVAGGQVGARANSAAVTLEGNISGESTLFGIAVVGGQGTYDGQTDEAIENSVRAALSMNDVRGAQGGILIVAGGGGPSDSNRIELIAETNRACMSSISDISCLGAFPGLLNFPANEGSGNVVSGVIRDNEASVVVADPGVPGNSCNAVLESNRICGAPTPTPTMAPPRCAGDCDGDGSVTVDEIVILVNIALGSLSPTSCTAGDVNHDGTITIEEIVAAVNRALLGC